MRVRIAEPSDAEAIADLLSRIAMPGAISISCRYQPSFFSEPDGERRRLRMLVGERDGGIVGVAGIATRNVHLDGEPTEVGYLGSLRLAPEARGSTMLARGYRLMGRIHDEELKLPFSLTSILRENRRAIDLLTSGRGGLPHYRFVAGYKTAAIPVFRSYAVPGDLAVVPGDEAGRDALWHCLERYGRPKDFFPAFRREEWRTGMGMFQGMRPGDFLVAFRGSDPVGCIALWDMAPSRRLAVRYSGGMRLAGMVDRAVGKITGAPLLPAPDQPFAPLYLSCAAVQNDDPALLRAMLAAALNRMRERKQRLLLAGFFEDDPLRAALDAFFHVPMYSDIYAVSWNGTAEIPIGRAGKRHFDVGSL